MQLAIKQPRISIPKTFDIEALRVWVALVALRGLKAAALLTVTKDGLAASAIANRIWPALVLVLFVRATISAVLRPNIYVLYLFFLFLIGIFSGNTVADIVTDGTIMMLPAIFWRQLHLKDLNEPEAYADFCESYLKLNIIGIFLFSVPGALTSASMSMDWNFMLPPLLSRVFTASYLGESLIYLSLFGMVSAFSLVSKTALGNIGIAAAGMTRGKTVLIALGVLVVALIVLASIPLLLETNAGKKLVTLLTKSNFSNLLNVHTISLLFNPALIFKYLDISTAERIFEFLQSINKISSDWFHLLFGYGLGASIDLTNSMDNSVLRSHAGDTDDVRVVHLAVTWFLLKGGIVGLSGYLLAIFWVIWHSIANIRSNRIFREYRWVWLGSVAALVLLFSLQTGASLYLKTPTLPITVMAVMLGRRLRKTPSALPVI